MGACSSSHAKDASSSSPSPAAADATVVAKPAASSPAAAEDKKKDAGQEEKTNNNSQPATTASPTPAPASAPAPVSSTPSKAAPSSSSLASPPTASSAAASPSPAQAQAQLTASAALPSIARSTKKPRVLAGDIPVNPLSLDDEDVGVAQRPDTVKLADWGNAEEEEKLKENKSAAEEKAVVAEVVEIEEIAVTMDIGEEEGEAPETASAKKAAAKEKEENKGKERKFMKALDFDHVATEQSSEQKTAPAESASSHEEAKAEGGEKDQAQKKDDAIAETESTPRRPESSIPIAASSPSRSVPPSSPAEIFTFDFSRCLASVEGELAAQSMDMEIKSGEKLKRFMTELAEDWRSFDIDLSGYANRTEFLRAAWLHSGREIEEFPANWREAEKIEDVKAKADELFMKARGDEEEEADEEDEEDDDEDGDSDEYGLRVGSLSSGGGVSFWYYVNKKLRAEEYQASVDPPQQTWSRPNKK